MLRRTVVSRARFLPRLAGILLGLTGVAAAAPAAARPRRVPEAYPTIQAAIDAADAGETIEVGPGTYCGATVDKPVSLVGRGAPTIVGCADGPSDFGGVRIGLYLPGADGSSAASGTHIEGFVFDGRGISSSNLEPLGLGVFGRFASDVRVAHNVFHGTVQAVTNTAGDRWVISQNEMTDIAVFDCTGSLCAGGNGVVIEIARDDVATAAGPAAPENRPEGNVVADNLIGAVIPDGFDAFSLAGVLVFAADGSVIVRNRVAIPDNPDALATGDGVLVTDACCGEPDVTPGARGTIVVENDGRADDVAVDVDGTDGANTAGLVVRRNLGTVTIEGTVITQGAPFPFPRFVGRRHRRPMF